MIQERDNGSQYSLETTKNSSSYLVINAQDTSGNVVGFARAISYPQRNSVVLLAIRVYPDNRKEGIGTSLIKQVEAWATSLGVSKVEAYLKPDFQCTYDEMVSFFENLGFSSENSENRVVKKEI